MLKNWACPNCSAWARTMNKATPMHACRGIGLMVPLIVDGARAKLVVVEREDYIGSEAVQYDRLNHRPVMSVITTRDDGEDCTVYAPTATATVGEVHG